MMRFLTLSLVFAFAVAVSAGCHNTKHRIQSLKNDTHSHLFDGDPEDLSEAEPYSSI